MYLRLASLLICLLISGGLFAQSPYQGQEARAIKSLSEQEIADFQSGEGMGFAKAAELNGYPGPAHVLELADQLNLTREQRARTQTLFELMKARATALGIELVETERRLDTLFAERTVTPVNLASTLEQIARLNGEIRRVHLETHLLQTELLSPEQVARYVELRGYSGHGKHFDHSHEHD